jgi:lipopolysaccharide/colanic/teichoic acid biosynthesis glycosyltransferase
MSRAQRVFDVVGAAGGLILFGPVMVAIAVAIVLDDGRPVFFRQTRIGLARRPFTILKFRTMRDGRVTRVGRLLRATGLDEIPQFINILRGDMSACGPRPLTPEDITRLRWTDPWLDFRWSCRPGLTGLAQLAGATSAAETLAYDGVHAAGWSPWLDCRLIFWSFVVNAVGKTRVRRWMRARMQAQTRVS